MKVNENTAKEHRAKLNELEFQGSFVGRQSELEKLFQLYHRTKRDQEYSNTSECLPSPICIIDGESGVGKTELIRTFLRKLKSGGEPVWTLEGKFNQSKTTNPYSAIVQAVTGFCESLSVDNGAEVSRIRELADTCTVLGKEGQALVKFIPCLAKILGTKDDASFSESKANELNRLKYLFQAFIKVVCTEKHPIVLFLDDLMWIDDASLELLTTLLSDSSLRHFMFIGTARLNELPSDHPLIQRLPVSTGEYVQGTRYIERIKLTNLSTDNICELIKKLLRLDRNSVEALAKVIYARTLGNIFFVKQMLAELQRKNFLAFSFQSCRWEFDVEKIERETSLSENVAGLLASKLGNYSMIVQETLKLAALLGGSFDKETLLEVIEATSTGVSLVPIDQALAISISAGLIQFGRQPEHYVFGHDRIQEAAMALVSSCGKIRQIRGQIARLLLDRFNSSVGEEWMLFVGVDHMNQLSTLSSDFDSQEKVRWNFEAGENAANMYAFGRSSKYLEAAVAALKIMSPTFWSSHYQLAMKVHQLWLEVEFSLGHFDNGERLSNEVFDNAATLSDKMATYLALANALGRRERHAEARDLCKDVLFPTGAFPRHFHLSHMLFHLASVMRYLRRHSDTEIISLPLMTDRRKLTEMSFLAEYALRCFLTDQLHTTFLSVLLQIKTTLKYGLCARSSQAFAAFGLILADVFGNYDEATRMGELTKGILEATKGKFMEPLALFTVAAFIDGWNAPRSHVLDTFQRAMVSGIQIGDFENAFRARGVKNCYAYLAGLPLERLEVSATELCDQCRQYGVSSILAMVEPFHMMIGILRSSVPVCWETICQPPSTQMELDSSNTYRLYLFYLYRLQIAFYFREASLAHFFAVKLLPYAKTDTSYTGLTMRVFFSGLAASGLAKLTGKLRYYRLARRRLREMRRMTKRGAANNLHKYLLMEADLLACSKTTSFSRKKDAYDGAIRSASRLGFSNDAALANELAGEFLLNTKSDLFWTRYYLGSARDLYEEWGACAKVALLDKKYGRIIEGSSRRLHSERSSTVKDWMYGGESQLTLTSQQSIPTVTGD